MKQSEMIDYIFDNINSYIIKEFNYNAIMQYKVLMYKKDSTDIYVHKISNLKILTNHFDKSAGCILNLSGTNMWYSGIRRYHRIPSQYADDDIWFNFSIRHNLTRETYSKYIEIIKLLDSLIN